MLDNENKLYIHNDYVILSKEISYPSKIIITGEHSVLYGSKVLSIAINNYVLSGELLLINNFNKNNNIFEVISNIDNNENNNVFNLSIQDIIKEESNLLWLDYNKYAKSNNVDLLIIKERLKDKLQNIIKDFVSQTTNEINNKEQFKLIISFLFNYLIEENYLYNFNDIKSLLYSFLKNNKNNNNSCFVLHINSSIPVGAGLGSSAAYTLAIVKSILISFKNIVNNNNSSLNLSKLLLKLECETFKDNLEKALAFIGETYLHSKTNGTDIISIYYKKCILFNSYYDIEVVDSNFFKNFNKHIEIFLINTNVHRSAYNVLTNISKTIVDNESNIKEMKIVSEKIIEVFNILGNNKLNYNDCSNYLNMFLKSIKINQELLKQRGASTSIINNIINVLDCEYISCKITGAGGGGFLLSFVLREYIEYFKNICYKNNIDYIQTITSF